MDSIVACRDSISERFPVASFTVNVPEQRLYEVVCATDPRLLHTDNAALRTPNNFYSSRIGGLLPARSGANAFVLPAEQLRRFAGARRIYYALGTYAGRSGEQPRFTISPDTLDRVPSVMLSSDFTGRSLDQRRLGQTSRSNHYGQHQRGDLRWGGDVVLETERAQLRRAEPTRTRTRPRDSNAYGDTYTSSSPQAGTGAYGHGLLDARGYDDGYDPSLWTRGSTSARTPTGPATSITHYAGAAGVAYEDAATLREDRRPPHDPTEHYGAVSIEDGAQAWKQQLARPFAPANVSATSYGAPTADVSVQVIEDGAQARSLGRMAPLEVEARRAGYGAAHPAGYGAAHPAGSVGNYEDAVALRALANNLVRALPDMRGRSREHRSGYGRRERTDANDDASSATFGRGRHPDYDDRPVEGSLPVGPAVAPLGEEPPPSPPPPPSSSSSTTPPPSATAKPGRPLQIVDKVRILRVVGRAESGEQGYEAALADVEFNDPDHPYHHRRHLGLSWGLLAFTQRSGVLGRVLALAKAREQRMRESGELPEEQRFERLFGEKWSELLERTDETRTPDPEQRLQPVDGAPLWAEPWLGRFRAAGKLAYVQAAQNQVGVEYFFDAILPLARALELNSARGLALLVDRVVHMGVGAGQAWIMDSAGPITSEQLRAQALAAVGHANDLAAFARARQLEGWTPLVHAHLCAELRKLERPPFALPSGASSLQRLVAAASSEPANTARVRALLEASELEDANAFDLG